MKALELLPEHGPALARALLSRKAAEVAALLDAARPAATSPVERAALGFGEASFALREGRLDDARTGFDEAAAAFAAEGQPEAAELARLEGAVARARRGRRELAEEAKAIAEPLVDAGVTVEVRARAALTLGTAARVMGDVAGAQQALVRALSLSEEVPEVRSMVLNSLGTLAVSLAAFGAAHSLCEHAAELCRLRKDVIGEAIAMGQLGAAALGRGELEPAKRYLSRQEWLSAQSGDAFGRTRALVWLAEVALESGRMDDAKELAEKAHASAASVEPPLTTFAAYADRVIGRAELAMGDRGGLTAIERARATFAAQRLPLGEALARRDAALAAAPIDRDGALGGLWTLASLGLPERVSESLAELDATPAVSLALTQTLPRRLEPLEAELALDPSAPLSALARPRTASRKNLSRLAVLALGGPGLYVAAARLAHPEDVVQLADRTELGCAVAGSIGRVALLVWPASLAPERLAAETLALASGGALALVLALKPEARVVSPGFGGGLGAELEGCDATSLVGKVLALDAGRAVDGASAELTTVAAAWAEAGV